jgi:hypothetical protein
MKEAKCAYRGRATTEASLMLCWQIPRVGTTPTLGHPAGWRREGQGQRPSRDKGKYRGKVNYPALANYRLEPGTLESVWSGNVQNGQGHDASGFGPAGMQMQR